MRGRGWLALIAFVIVAIAIAIALWFAYTQGATSVKTERHHAQASSARSPVRPRGEGSQSAPRGDRRWRRRGLRALARQRRGRPIHQSLRSFAAKVDTEAVLQESLLRVWQVAPKVVPDGRENCLLRLGVRIA